MNVHEGDGENCTYHDNRPLQVSCRAIHVRIASSLSMKHQIFIPCALYLFRYDSSSPSTIIEERYRWFAFPSRMIALLDWCGYKISWLVVGLVLLRTLQWETSPEFTQVCGVMTCFNRSTMSMLFHATYSLPISRVLLSKRVSPAQPYRLSLTSLLSIRCTRTRSILT